MKFSRTVQRNARNAETRLRACMNEGLTLNRTAADVGASMLSIKQWVKCLGMPRWWEALPHPRAYPLKHKPSPRPDTTERDEAMLALRKEGRTLEEIATVHGVTRERVRQILASHFPDEILTSRLKPVKECEVCGKRFHPRRTHVKCCSSKCAGVLKSSGRFDRDFAVRVMQLRSQGSTWKQVGEAICPEMSAPVFRSRVQQLMMTLFSTPEREYYFKTWSDRNRESTEMKL